MKNPEVSLRIVRIGARFSRTESWWQAPRPSGPGLLRNTLSAFGKGDEGGLTRGDVAILRLLAAAETIETDLWQQYNELGGVDAASSGYTAGLEILDGDQPQYISDNTMMRSAMRRS